MKNLCSASFTILLGAVLAHFGQAQLTESEKSGLERALAIANLTLEDLNFEKRVYNDPYRLPLVDKALLDPIGALNDLSEAQALARAAGRPGHGISQLGRKLIQAPRCVGHTVNPPTRCDSMEQIPPQLRPLLHNLARGLAKSNAFLKEALQRLTSAQRDDLLASLPALAVESEKVQFGLSKKTPLDRAKTLALVGKIDTDLLSDAAAESARAADEFVAQVSRQSAEWGKLRRTVRLGMYGLRVVVSGVKGDTYKWEDCDLLIDLGGDDIYRGRVGGGIMKCCVAIDLGGDDIYDLDDCSGGAGLLGCGLMYDLGGNDVFRGGSLTYGCGIAGLGYFYKEGGEDYYNSIALTQGFGFFGIGALVDTGGKDRYLAGLYAQGSARTRGFGWLIDRAGDDVYTIGGIEDNKPLIDEAWYGFGQGFGAGYREDSGGVSGGIGILSDLKGDDVYASGTYAQGASYWFALGALMDDSGQDTYSIWHYGQASAMHLTAGYLIDLAGNDLYATRWGASHAIGHDYGIAVLLDRSGNDVYAAQDSAPGIGNANGVGVFIESAGDDSYQGPPGLGNPARDSGSVGVFVDLGGNDKYRRGLADGQAGFNGIWGTALDIAPSLETSGAAPTETGAEQRPVFGSAQNPGAAELEKIYAKAVQWGVGSAQQEVRENTNRLIAVGLPALEWMLSEKLKTANRLAQRAFNDVAEFGGDAAKALIPPYIASETGDEALNALRICLELKITGAGPYLVEAMKKPHLRNVAIRTAGAIQAKEAVTALISYANGGERLPALAATIALRMIASPDAIPTFRELLTSSELPIRKAAAEGLVRFPKEAMMAAEELMGGTLREARIALEVLGLIGTREALHIVGKQLTSPQAEMRMEALRALKGRVPEEFQAVAASLANDPDPDVRAVYAWSQRDTGKQ